jgi:hypothetical protein
MVSETEIFHCTVPKLLIRKRYYVLFLIQIFIIQVTKLYSSSGIIQLSNTRPSTSVHFATRVRAWRVDLCTVFFGELHPEPDLELQSHTNVPQSERSSLFYISREGG